MSRIERERHLQPGGFSDLPRDEKARLLAIYNVENTPTEQARKPRKRGALLDQELGGED